MLLPVVPFLEAYTSSSYQFPLATANMFHEHKYKVSCICRPHVPQALQSRAVGGGWFPCKWTGTDPSPKGSGDQNIPMLVLHRQAANKPQCSQICYPSLARVPLTAVLWEQCSTGLSASLGSLCTSQLYRAKVCLIRL